MSCNFVFISSIISCHYFGFDFTRPIQAELLLIAFDAFSNNFIVNSKPVSLQNLFHSGSILGAFDKKKNSFGPSEDLLAVTVQN